MAKKLSATEQLARDICWLGFSNPKQATGGRSKHEYWSHVDPSAKKNYMEHAAELIWWTRRLGADRLAGAVAKHDARKGAAQ